MSNETETKTEETELKSNVNQENKKGMKSKNIKATIILGAILGILIIVFAGALFLFKPKATQGTKEITVCVVNSEQETITYSSKTDAEYLRGALEEIEDLTVTGTESEYGLMVDTVNGERADYTLDGAYWSFYVNGDYCAYGVDEQPVYDQDEFEIIYTMAE